MAVKAVVYSLSGKSWTVEGQQGWSVLETMKALEAVSGVPQREQRLILGNQELKETDLLSETELELTLVVRDPEQSMWLEMIKTVQFPQDVFRCAPEHIRDDQEIAWTVVSKHGFSLKFASENLRNTRKVVLAAVLQTGAALAYASETLRADKELVLHAVERHGAALEHASQELQMDREVVLAAVSNQARSLRFAAEELRGDPEVVSKAALKDASALVFASHQVLVDRSVMEPAVKRKPFALQYAGEALRSDDTFLEELRSYWANLASPNSCAQQAVSAWKASVGCPV